MQSASHPGKEGMGELEKLPKKLYEAIVFHMHGTPLSAVPLLRGLEPSFLQELSLTVSAHIVLPEEAVFEEGDISREMYFIIVRTTHTAQHCSFLTQPALLSLSACRLLRRRSGGLKHAFCPVSPPPKRSTATARCWATRRRWTAAPSPPSPPGPSSASWPSSRTSAGPSPSAR